MNISGKIRSIHRFISRKSGVSGLRAWEATIARWLWKALMVSYGSGLALTLTTISYSANPRSQADAPQAARA